MKVKTILVSQPEPKVENFPFDFNKNIKLKLISDLYSYRVNAKEIRLQKIDLITILTIILTSRNAVDHFFRVADEMRLYLKV
jgi:uroporphyrinogen-III synthase